jgi:hypothetical protein
LRRDVRRVGGASKHLLRIRKDRSDAVRHAHECMRLR